jgi:hypothetical protein
VIPVVVWYELATGKDQSAVPAIVAALVSVEIQEQFGKEAVVNALIFLELDFSEEDASIRNIFGRKKDAVDAKGWFLDFYRSEPVSLRGFGLLID